MIEFKNKTYRVESCWIGSDHCGGGNVEYFVDFHDGKNVLVFSTRDEAVKWACENEM